MKKLMFMAMMISFLSMACNQTMMAGEEKSDQPPKLKIRTEATGYVFIEPVINGQNKVFVKISDPTDQAHIKIAQHLKKALTEKGYSVVQGAQDANYVVQGNVISSGVIEPEILKTAYTSPFGAKFRLANKKRDPLASAVGFFAKKAKGKSYALIVDLNLTQNRKISSKRIKTDRSRCRIVSGIDGCHAKIEEAMPQIRDKFNAHLLSYF